MASKQRNDADGGRRQLERELNQLLRSDSLASTSAAAKEPSAPPKRDPRGQGILLAVALVLMATSAYFIYRHFRPGGISYRTEEKRPLLVHDAKEYHDAQLGVRFTPPPKWSMQLQSTEVPGDHRAERTMVKFKRVLPKMSAAWFRVDVVDTPPEQDLNQCVNQRSAGKDWKSKGPVEPTTVGGLPAARIVHSGTYDGFPSLREIIGVRRGGQVFYFVSTYQFADRQAQEQTRQAIQSVVFDSRS